MHLCEDCRYKLFREEIGEDCDPCPYDVEVDNPSSSVFDFDHD